MDALTECIICRQRKLIEALTVVVCDAEGLQRFACNSHFWNSSAFIVGLADFSAAEQERSFMQLHAEGRYEWSLH